MSHRRWVVVSLAFGLVLGAGWLRVGTAEDGVETAAGLLAKGQEAFENKDYELASIHLDDAYAASSDCLEALYLSAQAYEKVGKTQPAFLSYRAFLSATEERARTSKLPASLASCQRTAAKRVQSLGKTTLALEAIQTRHAEKLLAFARENALRAPDVAVRALERARDVAVETPAIDELLQRLRPRVDAPPDRVPSPFEEDVVAWEDLLVEETFGQNEGWTYAYGTLDVDVHEGRVVHARGKRLDSGPRYVYEVEARITKVQGEMWLIGLVFGHNEDTRLSVFIQALGVELSRLEKVNQRGIRAVSRPLEGVGVWHRLTVKVDGGSVEIWVDGEKTLEADEAKMGASPRGNYGVTFQDAVVEVRELRIGALR